MASKRLTSEKAVLEQLEQLETSDSDFESPDLSDSVSFDSSSSDSESDADSDTSLLEVSDVRTWCPLDCSAPHPAPPRFPFTGDPGLKVDVDRDDPLAYLALFLTSEVIEKIVGETNRFAEQQLATTQMRQSRNRRWEPVTPDEMWLFLGLIILQGLVGKPVQKWYWTTNRLLATPFFGTIMPEYRFSLIMKFLHFANNDEYDEHTHPAPKLRKIWDVYQLIQRSFRDSYVPERDVSVDESLMAYKGRLSWIQYIASKRARFGLKSYRLCESSSGYIWNSVMYTGKGTRFSDTYSQYGIATSSVLTLTEPLLNQGYCVTTDNFYTSPELYEVLVQNKTDCYGTVRPNRRNMPSSFACKKLKLGEIVAWQKGKIMALRWRDKKDVCLLSTVHNTATTMVHTRGGKDILKPQVVMDYNHTMGGVDKADQETTFYPAMRKQQKKYYKKIFRHLLEQCLWNAYVLFQRYSEQPGLHADFVWRIVEAIMLKHQRPPLDVRRPGRRAVGVVNPERLTGRHFVEYVPPTEKKATPTRMCVVCCSKRDDSGKKIRRETRYHCPDCDVGLCAVPCFKIYHTRDVY
ncbi:piggyBac transposable element-derived protein 4-like [Hyperolius riggenbachi]|uniref:piggyBac transposable element-derived protein 4-like n=1 Tax=Hyperolius riggenbachi TaxID=752182 RepID=UPI0035A33DAE